MSEFERLVKVIEKLRAEDGCPWDKEQTHVSLKKYCIEEAAEVISAINISERTGDYDNLCEELGDLLLQIMLHAQIAKENNIFDIDDVIKGIADKMIRRHPHVFGDTQLESMDAINATWDEIKKQEKKGMEWVDGYLPEAFEESKKYIDEAAERKRKKAEQKAEQKAEPKIIYFDMDGVLADFDRGVSELLGLVPIDQGKHTPEQDDIMFAAMHKYGHFYRDLKPMPGAIEMFKTVYERNPGRVEILTGVPKDFRQIDFARSDKREWAEKYLGADVKVHTVLRAEKPLLCKGPHCILVDDFEKNVKEWEENHGTGIVHTSIEETMKRLSDMGL